METCPTCSRPMPGGIREARLAKGLTIRALSELTGVPASSISRSERGKGGLIPKYRLAVASTLDLPLSQIPEPFPNRWPPDDE